MFCNNLVHNMHRFWDIRLKIIYSENRAADQSVSVPMTLSEIEWRDARDYIFRRISIVRLASFHLRPNSARQHVERSTFLGVSNAFTARGGVPSFPNFGVPVYLCTHRLTQKNLIWLGNTNGRYLFSHEGEVQAVPNFGVPFYLCVHPLSQ